MTTPRIEWSAIEDPDRREGTLWVDPSCRYFAGHFPDNPILPGFVQIRWARLACEGAFPDLVVLRFTGMSRIKFKRAVGPATRLNLTVVHAADQTRVRMKFT
ncbi:MAG: hypothetical protein O3A63_17380, partial [Proteobacteria bacterium]|nr:hypothetical protein [Pseudomonadota bacterium]